MIVIIRSVVGLISHSFVMAHNDNQILSFSIEQYMYRNKLNLSVQATPMLFSSEVQLQKRPGASYQIVNSYYGEKDDERCGISI
jgi:hypothetical protein